MNSFLWTAFVMGLAGSLHCFAMCGPLAMSLPGKGAAGWKLLGNRLLYNFGRIFSYLVIGVVFGLVGQALSLIIYQETISLITGIFLLLWMLSQFLPKIFGKTPGFLLSWTSLSSKIFAKLKGKPKAVSMLGFGVLNGFLPCGLVYLAATASLNQGNISYSILYMLLFGLGTLPMMLGLSLIINLLKMQWRIMLNKAVPYFAIIIACLFILRGLSLDIPYLSPKITSSVKGEIESSCCAKKSGCH